MSVRVPPLIALVSILLTLAPAPCFAGTLDQYPQLQRFFPMADRFEAFEGEPVAAAVYKGDELLGYAFRTGDIAPIPAYSGKPVNVLVGLDTEGRISGAEVLEHHEPILLIGIPEQKLHDFTQLYIGKSARDHVKVGAGRREGYVNVDAITGATVTVIVVNRSIMRAARAVAESRGIIAPLDTALAAPARVRMDVFEAAHWKYLTGNGAVRRMLLGVDKVEEAFKGTEGEGRDATPGVCVPTPTGETCGVFVDMHYAYLNAPSIGRNLLGETQYNWLMSELGPGEHAIAVMANGEYSFKGSGYVRGGIFDRIQLNQGEQQITFRDLDYHRLNDVYAGGMPAFREMAIFIIRAESRFDPGRPWQLELLVRRQVGALDSVFTTFGADYDIPPAYVEQPPAPVADALDEPMWVSVWRERRFQIAVLVLALSLLTLILLFQDYLARHATLLLRLRIGFLMFTLVFIGWYMLGQLSVVNVLTFVGALLGDFRWDSFLIDPTLFILWSFVGGTLLLWGRGVYCGWLCPFGALQKLVNEASRRLKIPQFNLPQVVHERLWALKYIILLMLFAISLQSIAAAERYAEIEPFKTAITLHFQREWGYALYAAVLVLISIFNGKFYCKYLCPLGAALAIPAKLRIFEWLRRRKECGRPCQICAEECEIQAIDDVGKININECHYCLDCQVTYYNAHRCPPLVERRKRHEKAERLAGRAQKPTVIPIVEQSKQQHEP